MLTFEQANYLADHVGEWLYNPDDDTLNQVTAADVVPYNDDIAAWVSPSNVEGDRRIVRNNPSGAYISLPRFLAWCRENQRGPWATTPQAEPVVQAGPFHVGDLVQYTTQLPSLRARGVLTVVRAHYPGNTGVDYTYVGGRRAWDEASSLELVACPHADPTVTPGNSTPGYTPWGPDHPDWDAFWDRAEAEAERRRYCNEFDAVVTAVGGRPRGPRREQMTLTVSLTVEVEGPAGFLVDPASMKNRLLNGPASGTPTAESIRVLDVTVEDLGYGNRRRAPRS